MNTTILLDTLLQKYSNTLANFYNIISKTSHADLFGWESEFTQHERFRVLLEEAINFLGLNPTDSFVDVGCGHADLYKYMLENNIKSQYTGIDFKKEYILECQKRYSMADFKVYDILKTNNMPLGLYDIVCMSGVLNLNIDPLVNSKDENYRIIKHVLSLLSASAKKGIVCNFLHTKSKQKDNFFSYHYPKELISYIENLGYKVLSLREDYLPNDFTLTIINTPKLPHAQVKTTSQKFFSRDGEIDLTHSMKSTVRTDTVSVYTDGGCSGNPGIGAWAFFIPDLEIERFGNELQTTNNRMELMATIEALNWAQNNNISRLRIYTDSRYVQKGITEWITTWVAKGWKTSNAKTVKNRDLWELLLDAVAKCAVDWQWIEGHAGFEGNEIAHNLVSKGIKQLK